MFLRRGRRRRITSEIFVFVFKQEVRLSGFCRADRSSCADLTPTLNRRFWTGISGKAHLLFRVVGAVWAGFGFWDSASSCLLLLLLLKIPPPDPRSGVPVIPGAGGVPVLSFCTGRPADVYVFMRTLFGSSVKGGAQMKDFASSPFSSAPVLLFQLLAEVEFKV